MKIQIIQDDLTIRTDGFTEVGKYDLSLTVTDQKDISSAQALMEYITTYINEQNAMLKPEETLRYGYWYVKFKSLNSTVLEIWEPDADCTDFVPGATLALEYMRQQFQTCQELQAEFDPPLPYSFAIISDGVYEGDDVEGIRYPSLSDDSGWWITTDRYNDDLRTLKKVHIYHVTATRPELAQYLALPFGSWFIRSKDRDTFGFDQEIASQDPV